MAVQPFLSIKDEAQSNNGLTAIHSDMLCMISPSPAGFLLLLHLLYLGQAGGVRVSGDGAAGDVGVGVAVLVHEHEVDLALAVLVILGLREHSQLTEIRKLFFSVR